MELPEDGFSDFLVLINSWEGQQPSYYITGGGQKVCTSRFVLPVADNIFMWMHFASVLLGIRS